MVVIRCPYANDGQCDEPATCQYNTDQADCQDYRVCGATASQLLLFVV